jgi:hypothetical protein
MKPHSISHNPSEQEIQHAAYYLRQEEGQPAHCDLEIWLAAKERLKHRLQKAGNPLSPKTAPSRARSAQAAITRRR